MTQQPWTTPGSSVNAGGAAKSKRSYATPTLIRYGSLNELTRGAGNAMDNDSGMNPGKTG